MTDMHNITMLGTGQIAVSYTQALQGPRSRDQVHVVYSRSTERGQPFAQKWNIAKVITDMAAAINDPETDVVVVALPNYLHEQAVIMAAQAGQSGVSNQNARCPAAGGPN